VTIVSSTSLYLTWLLELLTASVVAGAVVGAVFGVARAVPLLTTRHIVDGESLRASHRRWQAGLPWVRRLTVTVMGLGGVLLLAVAA